MVCSPTIYWPNTCFYSCNDFHQTFFFFLWWQNMRSIFYFPVKLSLRYVYFPLFFRHLYIYIYISKNRRVAFVVVELQLHHLIITLIATQLFIFLFIFYSYFYDIYIYIYIDFTHSSWMVLTLHWILPLHIHLL